MPRKGYHMKRIAATTLLLVCLLGCGYYGHREGSVQVADKSFLQFTGGVEDVEIAIDDGQLRKLEFDPNQEGGSMIPQWLYQLVPGRHRIRLYREDKMILDREIYLGSNETKEIQIP